MSCELSFVIPCYRSEHTLKEVVLELRRTMEQHPETSYEIIMVSDGSPDKVYDVIQSLCAEYSNCKGIELARNFGQHAALMAGYREVQGKIVISLDDDGQSPLESTFDLIAAVREGADIVSGAYLQTKQNAFRRFGSFLNDRMAFWLVGKPCNYQANSFSAARRFVIDEIVRYNNPYPYLLGLSLRSTKRVVNVPVKHRPRKEGKSGYTLKTLLGLWLNGFTAFSVKPLRVATVFGCLFAAAGFLWGLVVLIGKILNPGMQAGYASSMILECFIGGFILIFLGLLGEYVGRIYICLNSYPQYVVRNRTQIEAGDRKKTE